MDWQTVKVKGVMIESIAEGELDLASWVKLWCCNPPDEL
jgi:hypothetical protein